MKELANKVIAWCRRLAAYSEEHGKITRTFLSPPMHDVHRDLTAWMSELGMRVSVDAAGNLRGVCGRGRHLVIGSHLDTVPNAGAFDGVLGVVLGIALVEAVRERGLDTSIEIIGFSEEEGVRYGFPFIGSRAVAGTLDDATLAICADAIRAFGLDPSAIASARLSPEAAAYLEFHIEQGPALESLGLPVGIVHSIAGQTRMLFQFEGKAGHAGTTPMSLRADALAAAAEWIVLVEQEARACQGLVATVGRIEAEPNATNVIPAVVRASLDVRHPDDVTRGRAVDTLTYSPVRGGIRLSHETKLDQIAVPMDAGLRDRLQSAVKKAGYPVHELASGAGHDAMVLASVIPSAMLFLRSPGGISHHPDESVLPEDVEAALQVGMRFLEAWDV